MKLRLPGWASPSVLPADPAFWDFELDVREAERRKLERLVQLNTTVVPRLRTVGFGLLSVCVLLHNQLVLGQPAWTAWAQLTLVLTAYCASTWYTLNLFYLDLRKHFDLGALFLTSDLGMLAVVIYATGAERSFIFFLPMFRVADQAVTSFRRALVFAHLAPVTYLAVIAYAIAVDGRTIPPGPEVAKAFFIYGGSLYMSMIARTSDERRRVHVQRDRLRQGAGRRSRSEVGRPRSAVA